MTRCHVLSRGTAAPALLTARRPLLAHGHKPGASGSPFEEVTLCVIVSDSARVWQQPWKANAERHLSNCTAPLNPNAWQWGFAFRDLCQEHGQPSRLAEAASFLMWRELQKLPLLKNTQPHAAPTQRAEVGVEKFSLWPGKKITELNATRSSRTHVTYDRYVN